MAEHPDLDHYRHKLDWHTKRLHDLLKEHHKDHSQIEHHSNKVIYYHNKVQHLTRKHTAMSISKRVEVFMQDAGKLVATKSVEASDQEYIGHVTDKAGRVMHKSAPHSTREAAAKELFDKHPKVNRVSTQKHFNGISTGMGMEWHQRHQMKANVETAATLKSLKGTASKHRAKMFGYAHDYEKDHGLPHHTQGLSKVDHFLNTIKHMKTHHPDDHKEFMHHKTNFSNAFQRYKAAKSTTANVETSAKRLSPEEHKARSDFHQERMHKMGVTYRKKHPDTAKMGLHTELLEHMAKHEPKTHATYLKHHNASMKHYGEFRKAHNLLAAHYVETAAMTAEDHHKQMMHHRTARDKIGTHLFSKTPDSVKEASKNAVLKHWEKQHPSEYHQHEMHKHAALHHFHAGNAVMKAEQHAKRKHTSSTVVAVGPGYYPPDAEKHLKAAKLHQKAYSVKHSVEFKDAPKHMEAHNPADHKTYANHMDKFFKAIHPGKVGAK